jgi:hypothetical protein
MSTRKMFSRSDGYTEQDLLQSATDHLASARRLFEGGPRCFDSAGYLSHLGIELILNHGPGPRPRPVHDGTERRVAA